jgi:Sulfotransferase domain
MTLPKMSFCTTCKGRAQHIKLTLPKNLSDNADYPNAVFIILNYGSTDDLMEYLRAEHSAAIDSGRVVVYSYPATMFRMAHAKNMAHRLAIREGADILVNLDADNFTGPGFAAWIAAQFAGHGPDTFLAMGKMIPGVSPRGISGRIVVTKHAFLAAGGYDERFETWSPDDKDFNIRLRRMGYQWREIPGRFLDCVRHNDKMRFKEYRHVKTSGDSSEVWLNVGQSTVVNFGRIGMGPVARNFDPGSMELGAVPTRIFGIGMHKTGTTSLHTALGVLGFDSAHWPSAHWAKAAWSEMTTHGRSRTLERHYAAADLPLTILYRELDRAYPGSKFILTVRDEDSWIESVRRHWSPEHNRYRHQWNTDPFTHRIHRLVYGQKGFDAERFLARYRRHNEEVRAYFRDRPGDLLVMKAEDGWASLCAFLEKPMPAMAYPKANVAGVI